MTLVYLEVMALEKAPVGQLPSVVFSMKQPCIRYVPPSAGVASSDRFSRCCAHITDPFPPIDWLQAGQRQFP